MQHQSSKHFQKASESTTGSQLEENRMPARQGSFLDVQLPTAAGLTLIVGGFLDGMLQTEVNTPAHALQILAVFGACLGVTALAFRSESSAGQQARN